LLKARVLACINKHRSRYSFKFSTTSGEKKNFITCRQTVMCVLSCTDFSKIMQSRCISFFCIPDFVFSSSAVRQLPTFSRFFIQHQLSVTILLGGGYTREEIIMALKTRTQVLLQNHADVCRFVLCSIYRKTVGEYRQEMSRSLLLT
jgi:hypothetical protein